MEKATNNVWDYLVMRLTDTGLVSVQEMGKEFSAVGYNKADLMWLQLEQMRPGDVAILEEMPVMSGCGTACVALIEAMIAMLSMCLDMNDIQPRKGCEYRISERTHGIVDTVIRQCAIFIRG